MAFADPRAILEHFGLHAGQVVADLGAGAGFYTLEAAKMVSSGGKVYALDVQQELLVRLKNGARQTKLTNIEVVHGDIEEIGGTKLKASSIDAALVSNVLFQVEKKDDFVDEVKRILRTDGRALVIDWSESFGSMGPQPTHVVNESDARELFKKHGFVEVSMLDAGDHHYGIVFRKL